MSTTKSINNQMKKEVLKLDFNKKSLQAKLNAFGFKDGEFYILYIPSLEISAYGDDYNDAMQMLKESLDVFSEDIFNIPIKNAKNLLKKLGWQPNKIFKKKMEQTKNISPEYLIKEYNLPDNTTIKSIPIAI